jgi:uncharacterized membrane protein YGL010W
MSLFAAVAEIAVRIFYCTLYIKDGMKNGGKVSEAKLLAYQKRGKLRVQDGTNDRVC